MTRIKLVGKATHWEDAFPKLENEEVWTVAAHEVACKYADRIFEFHAVTNPWTKDEKKVFVLHKLEGFSSVTQIPLSDLILRYGRKFGGSLSYMLALAIDEKPLCIDVFGVDMKVGTEYGPQRDTFFYFVGLAEGKGITVNIPEKSGVYLNTLYGV